ncbi:hypothetical protein [Peribacillus frigoritolerans]|uniref:hypothetical protein n=1 Tax=Peribacillus frigoritolerans TaxID=450367 RepID=UPI003D2C642F
MKKLQLISEIRSLSADCLPNRIKASACGVPASQLFGRSVANIFNPIRITGKSMKDILILNMLRDETNSQFFFEKIAVDFRNPFPFHRRC